MRNTGRERREVKLVSSFILLVIVVAINIAIAIAIAIARQAVVHPVTEEERQTHNRRRKGMELNGMGLKTVLSVFAPGAFPPSLPRCLRMRWHIHQGDGRYGIFSENANEYSLHGEWTEV